MCWVMLVKRKYNPVSSFVAERGDLTEVPSQQNPFFPSSRGKTGSGEDLKRGGAEEPEHLQGFLELLSWEGDGSAWLGWV